MESELSTSTLVLPQAESMAAPLARPLGKTAALAGADAIAIVVSLVAATALRNSLAVGHVPITQILIPTIVVTLSSLIAVGLYNGVCENPVEEIRRSVLAMT